MQGRLPAPDRCALAQSSAPDTPSEDKSNATWSTFGIIPRPSELDNQILGPRLPTGADAPTSRGLKGLRLDESEGPANDAPRRVRPERTRDGSRLANTGGDRPGSPSSPRTQTRPSRGQSHVRRPE